VIEKTYREAIIEAMAEEMRRDDRVVLIGEDVGKFGGAMGASKGLFDEFGPERVIDTPISESAIVGSALGMALTGQRPVAELMFIDFVGVCMDQIANQVAKVRYMLGMVHAHPRLESGHAFQTRGCQGAIEVRYS
jgi:pyruvate dehydrogenase E1 component beta subunit